MPCISERLSLHQQMAQAVLDKDMAYRDFTPARADVEEETQTSGPWLFNPGMPELSREESNRRAAAGEPAPGEAAIYGGIGARILVDPDQ